MANRYSIEKAREDSKRFNQELEQTVLSNPELREAYERKRNEIEIALMMRRAREDAKISQEEIASLMHTTRSAVSRLESCGVNRHSPSIETLLKYAHALGYDVNINLVPMASERRAL